MNGVELIATERKRQIDEIGWTAEHDDQHPWGDLAWAAVCYAAPDLIFRKDVRANAVIYLDPWPWDAQSDTRPHCGNIVQPNGGMRLSRDQRIRQLAKAGALIAAEIDRLRRKYPEDK